MAIRYVFRPLPVWPYEVTRQRVESQFKHRTGVNYYRDRIPFEQTTDLLEREVWHLGCRDEVTLGVGLSPTDIRLDGQPRANARAFGHPGVELSFNSRHGRLTYATDVFTTWQDNVRAIALALEALRKVDRYGVAKHGQQYTGFALLAAGPGLEELGRRHVERWGSVKEALRHTHPDTGDTDMTQRDYEAVLAFRETQRVTA